MTSSTQMQRNPLQQAGRAVAVVFSLVIIAVIAFFVIDEANARFGVMAVSISIVALTSDKGRMGKLGWAIDLGLMAAFLYSAIWFFKVKQDLYTGFFTATPDNIVAGLAGMMAVANRTAEMLIEMTAAKRFCVFWRASIVDFLSVV